MQARRLLQSWPWKEAMWWPAVKVRQAAEIRVDHRDGRQVPEAFVAEVEYEVPVGREGPEA